MSDPVARLNAALEGRCVIEGAQFTRDPNWNNQPWWLRRSRLGHFILASHMSPACGTV